MTEADQQHHDEQPALFDLTPDMVAPTATVPAGAALTADRRRTLRQRAMLEQGHHPLSAVAGHLRLHGQAAPLDLGLPGRRCGNCRFRELLNFGTQRSFPKCTFPGTRSATDYERLGPPRVTQSAASDVRRWWPGCTDHDYGDPDLSPDAARYVPPEPHEG